MSVLELPGYEDAIPYTGEFETLPPGGYVCRIVGAKVENTQSGDKRMLALALDIDEGEKKGFYKRQYEADTSSHKKWRGTYRQMIPKCDKSESDNKTMGWFKGLIAHIEKSNPGFIWNKNTDSLVGKQLGCLFGREEYIGYTDNKPHWATKCLYVKTADSIRSGNFKIPEDKPLQSRPDSTGGAPNGFIPVISEEDLPF